MTAHEPSTVTWTSDQDSTDSRMDTKSLEIGMSGMSLVSGLHGNGPSRKETGSTISTTPPDEDTTAPYHPNGSRTRSGSDPPPSPSNNSATVRSHGSRPPGMGAPGPSPLAKPGHAKTTSNITTITTSLLSLTPNSSVDGNSEWTSRQPSPPGDVPSIPFLTSEHRRLSMDHAGGDSGSVNSCCEQHDEQDHDDGLLGLGALRERTHSAGSGQYSDSSPVARGHLPSHDPGRSRRERPSLSYPYAGDVSSHGGDRSVGERSTGSGGFQGHGVFEFGDPRGFGAIARPELRQTMSDFDPSVRSASSLDNFSHHSSTAVFDQQVHLSQKFGSLPSLGSHIKQHRGYLSQDLSKPRHIRSSSSSQPVPTHPPSSVHLDPRLYEQQRYAMAQQRAGVTAHPIISSSYDAATIHYANTKRNSLPSFSTSPTGYAHSHQSLERRDALDFHLGAGGFHGGSFSDDMRILGNSSLVSPGQSPHQLHYAAGHSRQPSDASHSLLSSSPMSMGNPMLRNHSVPIAVARQSSFPVDEDLLIGENIDVPAEHYSDAQFLFGFQSGGAGPLIRANSQGHSVSMGELHGHGHYLDAGSHHLPTAGAALPLPKVVYCVKFKRTQRNFVLGPRITRDLKIGTYVKVEADRGEDLGIVIGKISAEKFNFASRTQYTAGMGPPGGMGGTSAADLKRIIRLATHDEVSLLGIKREEEEELLKICRGKVRQRGLPMNVVDAEYQFDRHKLTFFFEAEGRVDFRELVRDLFSMYKTRIWMQQLDKNTATSAQAIISPQTNLQMDYGVPIIAPASEFADSIPMSGLGM